MKPKAVLISDIHFNLNTLSLADAATRQAITKANELKVPIFVAGDLHDTKANLRGECVEAMLKTFGTVETECFILAGNHDLINEKSDKNSLEFLDGLNDKVWLVRKHMQTMYTGIDCIAYHSDLEALRTLLKEIDKSRILIMHQGIQGSNSGEYIQDKSAIRPEDVIGFRVISGHYHTRQTIDLPSNGQWDYIGNPYTLNFAEANDPAKGYQILMDDDSLKFVPTNLRKHVVIEISESVPSVQRNSSLNPIDIVWVKVTGSKEWLSKIDKEWIRKDTGVCNFKLDLIHTDNKQTPQTKPYSKVEQLDYLIERSDTSPECKTRLKQLWRDYERN